MGSSLRVPEAFEQQNSMGSRDVSGSPMAFGYSPLPPSADQKPGGSSPSSSGVSVRVSLRISAIFVAVSTSLSLAPSPFHTYMISGVSSTKQSPLLSDGAVSGTCTARVSYSSVPRTWKREIPSMSYESASCRLRKLDALPPERTIILPLNKPMKCNGSLPMTTRTWVAAPPSSSSICLVRSAAAPFSSLDEPRPSQ